MRGKNRKRDRERGNKRNAGPEKGIPIGLVFGTTLACLVAGGGAYLVYDMARRRVIAKNNAATGETVIINNHIPQTTASKTAASANKGDAFPLKQGSRGPRVTQLQQALADKIGVQQMKANGGIDGKFGPGTANALKLAGYGEVVDETMFQNIVGQSSTSSTSMLQAKALYYAARAKNIDVVLRHLKSLNSPSEYSEINEHYKKFKLEFVGRTIVTDLLNYAFANNEPAKSAIKNEFLRIGLKVNSDGVWSLQGVPVYRDVITLRTTFVLDAARNRIPVNKNTILGHELRVANGITWVRAIDNKVIQVPTQDVKYA